MAMVDVDGSHLLADSQAKFGLVWFGLRVGNFATTQPQSAFIKFLLPKNVLAILAQFLKAYRVVPQSSDLLITLDISGHLKLLNFVELLGELCQNSRVD